MGRDQVHPVLCKVVIEAIAVIRPIANERLRLRLQHVEVESELDQRDLMMIGGSPRAAAHADPQSREFSRFCHVW